MYGHKGRPSSLPRPQCLALFSFSQVISLPLPYGHFSPPLFPNPLLYTLSLFLTGYLTSFLTERKKKIEVVLQEQDHLSPHTHDKPPSLVSLLPQAADSFSCALGAISYYFRKDCPSVQSPLSCFCTLKFSFSTISFL